MNDRRLLHELNEVGLRYRRLLLRVALAGLWLWLAVAGLALLARARGGGYVLPGVVVMVLVALPVLIGPWLLRLLARSGDPLWVARRIERKFPDLDARLLAAVEQKRQDPAGPLGYLQDTVIAEALAHAKAHDWRSLVPRRTLALSRAAQWATLLALAVVLTTLVIDARRHGGSAAWLPGVRVAQREAESFEIKVEPEDTEVERGTGLLVLARFGRDLPGDVQLITRAGGEGPEDGEGQARQAAMTKSLDDPVFAARVPSVDRDMTYAVRYGGRQTRWFKVGVFDYPDLTRADAKLDYPQYTGLPGKTVEDTRSVTAVEGTKATLTFRLNKPVKEAKLVDRAANGPAQNGAAPPPVALSVDPKEPTVYSVALDLKQSRNFRLHLLDEAGRANKEPAELALNVTANRPPELKLEFPGRDVDVSPLEELSVRAQVWDDFGVKRVGIRYGIAGREPKDEVLSQDVKGSEKKQVAQLLSLEELDVEPDQLLAYHLWVEDLGPDGAVRRTSGDMFFAEVRPFDQIYRQGEQPAGGEGQQEQQQSSQNAQQAEELAELQKQIVNAIWKLVRRETAAAPTEPFAADAKLVAESQDGARQKAGGLAQRLQDPRSKAHLESALKNMQGTAEAMAKAAGGPAVAPLPGALASAQAAYQDLLKLRAREHQVVRGQRQQRQQAGGGAAQRRQQQLDQLELNREENRYEAQRNAAPQQETAEQRETRQVMNRLRELAQRQEDLNRQMRELQSALEAERDEQKRQEIQRQLARLRDQQRQQLRDADELRDRMGQPENQQRMAEARQQLEQTRQDLRNASEALEKGQVPQAQASGARAGEQLQNLRDEFRKATSGQFNEQMDRMRQEARALDRKQQELSKQLTELDAQQQRTLRDGGERQQVTQGLGEQRKRLGQLTEEMKKTVEASEATEPLLSRKLYDAIRQQHQQQTDDALDASQKLLEGGFLNEARQYEAQANKGVTKLREGVEQAAEAVLGDEAEALRRARNELDALAQELEREIGRNRPDLARGPSTRPGRGGAPGTRPATGPSPDEAQYADARTSRLRDRQEGAGQQEGAEGEENREGRQPGNDGQPGGEGQQPGQQQPGGQQPGGQQPGGQQPGGQERTEVADAGQQQGQSGQRPGRQQGQQGQQGGRQPGQQPGQGRDGQQEDQQPGEQDGGQQPGGQRTADARGGGGGLRRQNGNPQQQQQGDDPQQPQDGQPDDGQPGGRGGDDLRQFLAGGERNGSEAYAGGSGPNGNEGPLTGGNFREWSDRLRDVEEMVTDPKLRAEAARIRDRARAARAEFTRHSKQPNWDVVNQTIGEPLAELRDAVAQELLRRESSEALVPIDREPVPPEYAEQVRKYYERLGSGRQ